MEEGWSEPHPKRSDQPTDTESPRRPVTRRVIAVSPCPVGSDRHLAVVGHQPVEAASLDEPALADVRPTHAAFVMYAPMGRRRSSRLERQSAMTVKRMDNVGIVVESLDEAISFFAELGLDLEGRSTIEGAWAGRVTGLGDQRVEIAMMRTPDGHSRLELMRFLAPPVAADHRTAPVNALGYLRVMFTVEDLDDTLTRLRKRGAQLVGDVVQYKDAYRLCYIRGPEGLLLGLAQELG
jgi:catechol 2,3-dioxygenase-like lactoylglutathione lyase family enzyme